MLLRPEIGLLGVAVLSVAVTAHTIPRQSGEDSNQDHPVNYQGHPKDGRYKPSRGGKATCISGTTPIEISSPVNIKFNYEVPHNSSQVTQTFLSMVSSGSTFAEEITGETQNVSGTYNIYHKLCLPSRSAKPKAVQFLTHGIGFNHIYWDFAPGYSYVDAAAEAGYATFLYDRLGVGHSSKPDAIEVVQAALELSIAERLIQNLRSTTPHFKLFEKVVAVGHSFGSIITEALAADMPQLIDAAVLTGFSVNMSAIAPFTLGLNLGLAAEVDGHRFHGLSNGYLISNNLAGFETGFLKAPGFDSKIASEAFKTADTATLGELFTQGAISKPALNFTGPVAIVNGDSDLPFCFGNCSFPTDLAAAPLPILFPQSSASTSYLAKNAGHGLNLHYSALDAYKFIQDFLLTNGIAP